MTVLQSSDWRRRVGTFYDAPPGLMIFTTRNIFTARNMWFMVRTPVHFKFVCTYRERKRERERERELVYTYSYGPHTLTYPEPFPEATRASVACATLTAGIAEHKSWDTDAISLPFMS